ncbi:hypothetical protein PI23P_11772 [Polaribacter irgensii 23-P]|uniref:Uncharacterized protein n=1 Tax=Polaribacter irgensii 23-P TaxID=313594 RepID=A4C1K7_9FLAO|nr:acyloxyacyl hydrolase [Polaribacter irgensii]EAR12010.1 hypothetical protein PI23P_11772 [Polaribacter irgensii 23-P]
MHLYAFELGLAAIDKRSERLADGFTFIENGSLGLSYSINKNTFLYLGSNIGHVSNLDFKTPNAGFSLVGFEAGFSYVL